MELHGETYIIYMHVIPVLCYELSDCSPELFDHSWMPLDWLMAKSSEGHNMQVPAGQFSHKSHIFLRTMDYSCPEENTILKTLFNFLVQMWK